MGSVFSIGDEDDEGGKLSNHRYTNRENQYKTFAVSIFTCNCHHFDFPIVEGNVGKSASFIDDEGGKWIVIKP